MSGCSDKKAAKNEVQKNPPECNAKVEEKCPLKKIKVVELVEVISHNGTEKDIPCNGRKQYVNLNHKIDPENPHPEYGRYVTLKARIEWEDPSVKDSLSGQPVYWYSSPKSGNDSSLKGSEKEGFDSEGGKAKTTEKTDDKGWTPKVKFFLSQCGGDEFDVYATVNPEYKDGLKAGTYTVWRKLWYEVDTMKKRGGGTLDMAYTKLPSCFTPAYVELELQGKDNTPDNKWNLQTSELHDFANKYFGAEKSPHQAHEIAIDHQADKKEEKKTFLVTDPVSTVLENTYFVYDGENGWLKSARYNDGSGWKTLAKDRISLVKSRTVLNKIKVDLTAGPVQPTARKPIEIEVEYVLSKEWSGDGSYKPHALIAMGYWYDTETEAEALKRTLGTMAHELGHLLGMVPKSATTWVDTGTGYHCTDTNCVMYSTNTSTRGNAFCSECLTILRKTDLTSHEDSFKHSKGSSA